MILVLSWKPSFAWKLIEKPGKSVKGFIRTWSDRTFKQTEITTLSIYKFCLSWCLFVCLSVCLYPINVKTAEPIGPKFFVGHLGTPGKVYKWSKFQILVSIKIRSPLNFLIFWKSTKFFCKNPRIIFVLFFDVHKENMFTINLEDGREAPSKARKKGAKRLEFLVYI